MKIGIRLLAVSLVACVPIAFTSLPAAAASGAVEVSDDGTTFGTAYSGTLFGDIAYLVPGDSEQERFYLRNAGDATGFLRITLRDVTSTDTDFAQALSISASTASTPGAPVVVGSVNPCWVLVEGQRVGPGEVVAVDATLALGNLDGLAGQGATAGLTIRVSLDDAGAGTLPPTDCGSAGTDVPLLPPAPGATPDNRATAIPPFAPGNPFVPVQPPGEATGDLPVLNLPGGIVIDPNTWHLYEEFLVLVLLASFVLGTGWFMMVAWRRRKRDDGQEADVMA